MYEIAQEQIALMLSMCPACLVDAFVTRNAWTFLKNLACIEVDTWVIKHMCAQTIVNYGSYTASSH